MISESLYKTVMILIGRIILVAVSLLSISCSLIEDDSDSIVPGKESVYAGIYAQGIEESSFRPCFSNNEIWQLSSIKDTTFSLKFRKVGENPVYMELRGVPSERGEYHGFFTTYNRRFKVDRVIMVDSRKSHACL